MSMNQEQKTGKNRVLGSDETMSKDERKRKLQGFLDDVKSYRQKQGCPKVKVSCENGSEAASETRQSIAQENQIKKDYTAGCTGANDYGVVHKVERDRKLNEFMLQARAQRLQQLSVFERKGQEDSKEIEVQREEEDSQIKKELLEKHLAQFRKILSIQPQRHTEEQILQERRRALLREQQKRQEELQHLRLMQHHEYSRPGESIQCKQRELPVSSDMTQRDYKEVYMADGTKGKNRNTASYQIAKWPQGLSEKLAEKTTQINLNDNEASKENEIVTLENIKEEPENEEKEQYPENGNVQEKRLTVGRPSATEELINSMKTRTIQSNWRKRVNMQPGANKTFDFDTNSTNAAKNQQLSSTWADAQSNLCKQLVSNLFVTQQAYSNTGNTDADHRESHHRQDAMSWKPPPPPAMNPLSNQPPQAANDKGRIIPCTLPLPFGMPMELPEPQHPFGSMAFNQSVRFSNNASHLMNQNQPRYSSNYMSANIPNLPQPTYCHPNQSKPTFTSDISADNANYAASETNVNSSKISEPSSPTKLVAKSQLSGNAKPFVPENKSHYTNKISTGTTAFTSDIGGDTELNGEYGLQQAASNDQATNIYRRKLPRGSSYYAKGVKQLRRPLKVLNNITEGTEQGCEYLEDITMSYDTDIPEYGLQDLEFQTKSQPEVSYAAQQTKRSGVNKSKEIGSGRIVFNSKNNSMYKKFSHDYTSETTRGRSKVGSGRTTSPRGMLAMWRPNEDFTPSHYFATEESVMSWELPANPVGIEGDWRPETTGYGDFVPSLAKLSNITLQNETADVTKVGYKNPKRSNSSGRIFSKAISDLNDRDKTDFRQRTMRKSDF